MLNKVSMVEGLHVDDSTLDPVRHLPLEVTETNPGNMDAQANQEETPAQVGKEYFHIVFRSHFLLLCLCRLTQLGFLQSDVIIACILL